MPDVNWIQVVLRWLHIIPAITLLGGTIFMALAMHPALGSTLGDDAQREAVRSAIAKRWKMVVHLCVLLLFASGMFNFITFEASQHEPMYYHVMFGVKFLLALVLFFFAEAMVGKAKVFDVVRRNAGRMLMIMALMGIVIVLISGVMKNYPVKIG